MSDGGRVMWDGGRIEYVRYTWDRWSVCMLQGQIQEF